MSLNKQDFLRTTALEVQTLELWIEQRWLLPETTQDAQSFTDRDVARARFIGDLKHALGVNDEGIDVVLHLIDQIHGLRSALAQLRDRQADKQRD